jgi:hypothetical protein
LSTPFTIEAVAFIVLLALSRVLAIAFCPCGDEATAIIAGLCKPCFFIVLFLLAVGLLPISFLLRAFHFKHLKGLSQ